jgi:hypothetical protein
MNWIYLAPPLFTVCPLGLWTSAVPHVLIHRACDVSSTEQLSKAVVPFLTSNNHDSSYQILHFGQKPTNPFALVHRWLRRCGRPRPIPYLELPLSDRTIKADLTLSLAPHSLRRFLMLIKADDKGDGRRGGCGVS